MVKIKKKTLRYSACALLLVFCLGFAFSQNLSVIINPVGKTIPVSVYPYEIINYNLIVINNDIEKVEGINLKVRTDPNLMVVVNGKELTERKFFIDELLPDETRELTFQIKPMLLTSKKLNVYIDYGIGEELVFTNSTNVEILESVVSIDARLSKTAVSPDEEASLFLDIRNNGEEKIEDVNIVVVAEEGLDVKEPKYKVEFLDPGQAFTNKEFLFSVANDVEGKKDLLLRVSYKDSAGVHVFEKVYFVDVRGRTIYFIALVIAIIILAVLSYVIKKKTEKKEVDKDIEVQEIESKEAAKTEKK